MKNCILVASGKGGVGKSTVAVNLAVALAKAGKRIALVDGDIYGPSVPTLMGGGEVSLDHEQKLLPPARFGVKYMSIEFFLPDPDSAVIWRGPMLTKAMQQMFRDVNWGELDGCIVDLPPGTGDAHISLAQNSEVSITGAIIVTTPQEVALKDVRKSINMLNKVNIPILGVIENMSSLLVNGEELFLFGKDGGKNLAKKLGVPLLAKIAIYPAIANSGDKGEPFALTSDMFDGCAEAVLPMLDLEIPRVEVG